LRPAANPFGLCAVMALAACSSESQPTPAALEPRVVDMAQLDAAVKQNLGRGTLVNVWATW
jgi:hypothetical protein